MNLPSLPQPGRRAAIGTETALGLAALVGGAAVALYGLLLLPASLLGGAHVVAIGLSLAAAGAFSTDPVGDRLGLSAARRCRLALGSARSHCCSPSPSSSSTTRVSLVRSRRREPIRRRPRLASESLTRRSDPSFREGRAFIAAGA
ncbi:hypothetical protein ABNG03_15865 [Halorubrum sp. RMP-47]|uniref:Uncharacterized protein n=1 Tax=Halorubrum miltondacostae TaxID=3076378 RepID=A0ABD5MA94_9EURY